MPGGSTVDGKRNNIAKASVRLYYQSFMIILISKLCYPAGLQFESWHISSRQWWSIFFNYDIGIPSTFQTLSKQEKNDMKNVNILYSHNNAFIDWCFFFVYGHLFEPHVPQIMLKALLATNTQACQNKSKQFVNFQSIGPLGRCFL